MTDGPITPALMAGLSADDPMAHTRLRDMLVAQKHTPGVDLWYFLDDEREPVPTDERHWVIFRTGEAMLETIHRFGLPDGITFDHDLGDGLLTGHDVAKALIEMFLDGNLMVPANFRYEVHSQNSIGSVAIRNMMVDLMRLNIGDLN